MAGAADPVVRVGVTVTFLRMDRRPTGSPPPFPAGAVPVHVAPCSVVFYRYLYHTVGASYVWWLRRVAPDSEIAELLAHPQVEIHALYCHGEPYGFHELDAR